ncbi:hypothetical protein KEM55_004589 [Ascosphaera atra]|nr:hypothetical protein KEM55_004589 [Ascosphaera atra]
MFQTPCMLAKRPSFLKSTFQEMGRLTKMGMEESLPYNMEALDTPRKPYYLLDFENPETVVACKPFADNARGGYSTVNLDHIAAKGDSPAHARFHGTISTKLPADWRVQKSGWAAFRSRDRHWLFGRLYWDMDPYKYLALRVKSDGRRYTVNIQTDSIVESDLHQHRLFTHHHRISGFASGPDDVTGVPRALSDVPPEPSADAPSTILTHTRSPKPDPTGWETVFIKWTDFVRTNYGVAVEPQTDITKHRIRSIGIGLTDRVEGPYDLSIHRVWATNGMMEEEIEEEKRLCGQVSPGSVSAAEEESYEPQPKVDDQFQGLEKLKKKQQ